MTAIIKPQRDHTHENDEVELWFARIERDVIACVVFTSVTELKRKLMKSIRHYNKNS